MSDQETAISYATVPVSAPAESLQEVTAMILAGGLGTRLRSCVADRSKVMAPIRGRTFITYLLDQLERAGIRHAALCTGYFGRQVRETLGEVYRGLRLSYSHETAPLGTAGALRQALPFCDSATMLVLNGDSFCEANLPAFWACHREHAARGTILLTHVPDTARYGSVQLDNDGNVTAFVEKGANSGPGWVSAGIYLLNKELVMTILPHRNLSLEREILPNWAHGELRTFREGGRFLDIGTPESYALAERFFTEEMVK